MTAVAFENVTKCYQPGNPVIDRLDLSIQRGAFVMLVGASGCGKTTMLKMINKLISPSSGEIRVMGKSLSDWDTKDLRRSVGYVIQHIGLFPHMKIGDNISYVLRLKKTDKAARQKRAEELIDLVGMDAEYLHRYPHELSGGQRQRIGVARALAADPDIILMDEPFGAVDEIARRHLQDEIARIHSKLQKTIVFVTHDIHEALKLGTHIILLNNGRIEQMGSRDDLIFRPQTAFAKDFFGIKGFKATLDEHMLSDAYDQILSGDPAARGELRITLKE